MEDPVFQAQLQCRQSVLQRITLSKKYSGLLLLLLLLLLRQPSGTYQVRNAQMKRHH
jgi:hypothetical protein